jgi:hypothetical protein
MFVVVNLHRTRVNVGFERVVGVGQWRKRVRGNLPGGDQGEVLAQNAVLSNRASRSCNGGRGERSGFEGVTTGHHKVPLVLIQLHSNPNRTAEATVAQTVHQVLLDTERGGYFPLCTSP